MAPPSLSFVLPVSAAHGRDPRDLVRARWMIASFQRFFERSDLACFWVPSPPDELDAVRSAVRAVTDDARFRVVSELDVCPELANDGAASMPGWYRQQLLKLAIGEHVDTSHYVTLDSDVLCVRPFGTGDLFFQGRAICGVETRRDYRELYEPLWAKVEKGAKSERVERAEQVLGARRPRRYRGRFYSETPGVFAVEGIRLLADHLSRRHRKRWLGALLELVPWTEQTLYFQALEAHGRLESLHECQGRNAVLRLDDSLWKAPAKYRPEHSPYRKKPSELFEPTHDGPFVVFQSYLGDRSFSFAADAAAHAGF